jgi:hypothetical protein
MFKKSETPPIKHLKGRCYGCKICMFKKSKYKVIRRQDNGTYKVLQLTLKERIKELFN